MPKLDLPPPPRRGGYQPLSPAALAAASSWATPPEHCPLPPRPLWQQPWYRVAVVGAASGGAVKITRALDRLHASRPIGLVVTTDNSAAGRVARAWARQHSLAAAVVFSNPTRDGAHAAQQRDAALLHKLTPQLIVDFAGGAATAWLLANAVRHYNSSIKRFP